jgi:hypothetical protein
MLKLEFSFSLETDLKDVLKIGLLSVVNLLSEALKDSGLKHGIGFDLKVIFYLRSLTCSASCLYRSSSLSRSSSSREWSLAIFPLLKSFQVSFLDSV